MLLAGLVSALASLGPWGLWAVNPTPSSAALQFAPIPTPAEIERARLRGIAKVFAVVEELSADAAKCSLRKSEVELAVARPLIDGGIYLPQMTLSDPRFYVVINVMAHQSGLCVANIDVEVTTTTLGVLAYQVGVVSRPTTHSVVVWEQGTVMAGSPSIVRDGVLAKLREVADQFVTKVKIANLTP